MNNLEVFCEPDYDKWNEEIRKIMVEQIVNEVDTEIMVTLVEDWLKKVHYDVDPAKILDVIPVGWKELGEMVSKICSLYPEVKFKEVKIYNGYLKIVTDLDKTDKLRYNVITCVLHQVAKMSTLKCMITGAYGRRNKLLETKPCLSTEWSAKYFNYVTSKENITNE